MNFLAHLHLAEATPESRLGNLLGDFVKGLPWDDRFSEPIWQGIMEHRFIDVFTDSHDIWKQSRDRLAPDNRRYAGVVIDVFYDFFLHKHWDEFHTGQIVEDYIDEVHRDLVSLVDQAPRGASHVFRRLIDERWLMSYGEIGGIKTTLSRVASSSPNLSAIEGLDVELERNLDGLESDFLLFYPEARAEMLNIRKNVVQKHKSFVTTKRAGDIR